MIWFNLAIPFLAILIMGIFFRKKMVFWEYLIIFVIPLIAIIIAKFSSVHTQTKDTEYWNFYLTSATYYEYWETWVEKTCQRCHEECSGSGEDRTCHTECEDYDCSYCDHNPARWVATDNMGNTYSISEEHYKKLVKQWGNETKIELNRDIDYHFGCGQDGDAYTTRYNGILDSLEPITISKTYENKVQCSKSVFNFPEVKPYEKQSYGLYEYPNDANIFFYNPILGWNDMKASKKLEQWNGFIGSTKKVHLLICVFKNKPLTAAKMQESYWKRGNKNEFIVCIGTYDNKKIDWVDIISWTDNHKLKIDIRENIAEMDTINMLQIVDYVGKTILSTPGYVKKSFRKDFNYLTVEPTPKAVMVAFIITLILTIGLCLFSYYNQIDSDEGGSNDFNRRYTRRF